MGVEEGISAARMSRTVHAIIGTAGHIDHGKTALIKALTGRDTDRLKEEKERGISIDLGFAYITLGEITAGIVDVPGHERFIKNMLAGAHGVDLVLLVIAADDGIMPQTEEHLDIVHLLGVRRGIIVITKADLVDAARLEAVRGDAKILTLGTCLEEAPVVEVSATTGAGLEELKRVMAEELVAIERPRPAGHFRMPVDRAFLIKGHGVVVTGTAIAGEVRLGQEVRILPGGRTARVRGIQVHDRAATEAGWGERVALNLAGVEKSDISRGQVVADPRISLVTRQFDALVEVRPGSGRRIENHAGVRVHVGTAEVLGKVALPGGKEAIAPGERAYCRVRTRQPLVAFPKDRFILRSENARFTLGGGEVVNILAERRQRRMHGLEGHLEALRTGSLGARARALLEMQGDFALPLPVVAQGLGVAEEEVLSVVGLSGEGILPLPGPERPEALTVFRKWEEARKKVVAAIGDFHRANPLAAGIEMESVRSLLGEGVSIRMFRVLVERLVAEEVVRRQESLLCDPGHKSDLGGKDREVSKRIAQMLEAGGFSPPDLKRLEAAVRIDRKHLLDLLGLLEREGKVVRVSPELYFSAASLNRVKEKLVGFLSAHGEITAAGLRDMLGISRKFSVPLLEYFDRSGVTLRVGDARKLRR